MSSVSFADRSWMLNKLDLPLTEANMISLTDIGWTLVIGCETYLKLNSKIDLDGNKFRNKCAPYFKVSRTIHYWYKIEPQKFEKMQVKLYMENPSFRASLELFTNGNVNVTNLLKIRFPDYVR